MMNPQNIGLARHSLSSAFRYFAKIELPLNYQFIIYNSHPSLVKELEADYPIDTFVEAGSNIHDYCPAHYILKLPEYSFARWGAWPTSIPAIKMGIQLLETDDKVKGVYFGDSYNSMTKWMTITSIFNNNDVPITINYRPVSISQDMPGPILIKTQHFQDNNFSSSIYEICLDTITNCRDDMVKGLFDRYYQERMYGISPFQLDKGEDNYNGPKFNF
ncbi:MAG: hypothetical protein EOP34_02345 [Rickettsiales bacterium]|nr:MAG: hypothetical protein EOP34_02345 [Rickettsiales bacterium]